MHPDNLADDIAGLERLSKKTAEFIGEAFDWISYLHQHPLLTQLYYLQSSIDAKLVELKQQPSQKENL